MKVTDQTTSAGRTTTLNEVPEGQVFRGEVRGVVSKQWTTMGVFYKAHGPCAVRGAARASGERTADVVVVRLDTTETNKGFANIYLFCSEVRNYEPLNVELVIKGVQR